jgi:L,D-transpeptidase YbiS
MRNLSPANGRAFVQIASGGDVLFCSFLLAFALITLVLPASADNASGEPERTREHPPKEMPAVYRDHVTEYETHVKTESAGAKPAQTSRSVSGSTPANPIPGIPLELDIDRQKHLEAYGWGKWTGGKRGVWVSVDEQVFRILEGALVLWQVPCSTAAKGTGSEIDSFRTPLGWHCVSRKTGAGAPRGMIFRNGQATGEIWQPGEPTGDDLILTRILFLDGREPGKNKGGHLDSAKRCIYIHGTNCESRIGTPSSHGCVRLRNDDVITAYDLIPAGTPVLISEGLNTARKAPVSPSAE